MSGRRRRPGSLPSLKGVDDRAYLQYRLSDRLRADPEYRAAHRELRDRLDARLDAYAAAHRGGTAENRAGWLAIDDENAILEREGRWEIGVRFGEDRMAPLLWDDPRNPPADEPLGKIADPPTREVQIVVSPLATRAALLAHATRELTEAWEAVVREAEEAGWRWPDTAPNEERDLDWLYLRLRGRSWGAIAAAGPPGPDGLAPMVDTVKHAVRAMAARAGVRLGRETLAGT